MVDPHRYVAHYTAKADEIAQILKPFGSIGFYKPIYGAWCKKERKLGVMGCITCSDSRFCGVNAKVPLSRKINFKREKRHGPTDDWGLHAIWHGWRSRSLSHPELMGKGVSDKDQPQYDLPPELDAIVGVGLREMIAEREASW